MADIIQGEFPKKKPDSKPDKEKPFTLLPDEPPFDFNQEKPEVPPVDEKENPPKPTT